MKNYQVVVEYRGTFFVEAENEAEAEMYAYEEACDIIGMNPLCLETDDIICLDEEEN